LKSAFGFKVKFLQRYRPDRTSTIDTRSGSPCHAGERIESCSDKFIAGRKTVDGLERLRFKRLAGAKELWTRNRVGGPTTVKTWERTPRVLKRISAAYLPGPGNVFRLMLLQVNRQRFFRTAGVTCNAEPLTTTDRFPVGSVSALKIRQVGTKDVPSPSFQKGSCVPEMVKLIRERCSGIAPSKAMIDGVTDGLSCFRIQTDGERDKDPVRAPEVAWR
jgi:hypothetical protein